MILASHFQLSLSSRWNGEADRRERTGREGEGPARLPGRGEVPSKRRRVIPAPRSYSANLRIHEDE